MKEFLKRFLLLILVVFLILTFLSNVCVAKKSKKAWLEDLPGRPPRLPVGKDTYLHNSLAYPGINVSSGITKVHAEIDSWTNLPVKSSISVRSVLIATNTLVSGASTWAETLHTQMDVPRNIGVSIDENEEGLFSSSNSITFTCAITGEDARKNTITETVTSSATINYSNNAFSKITGTVWTITSPASDLGTNSDLANIRYNIGTGDKIGFMGDIDSTSEFYKCTVAYVDETGSVTANAQYDTWTHSDVPDGSDDYIIYYILNSEANPR